MDDHNAILYLRPYNEAAHHTLGLPQNAHRVAKAPIAHFQRAESVEAPVKVDESTPGHSQENTTREGSPIPTTDELVLRLGFDIRPNNNSKGFVFGRGSRQSSVCDIILAASAKDGISREHFRIHFNMQSGLLMVTDTSRVGTRVGSEWIKNQSRPLLENTVIYIGISKGIAFGIEFPERRGEIEAFEKNHREYFKSIGGDKDHCITTAGASPTTRPIGGDHFILHTVGTGNFGTVHAVVQKSTGAVFAAKELRQHVSNRDDRRVRVAETDALTATRLPREVDIFSKLNHPHIVKYIETLFWHGSIFVIMEFLPFGNLTRYQHSQPHSRLRVPIAKAVLRQVLEALVYLHDRNITHRDIKPDNILVERQNPFRIKLSDFGLSSEAQDPRTFCGTKLYLAPEIYNSRHTGSRYDNRVDIWSLGVVMLELLIGLPRIQNGNRHQDGLSQYHERIQSIVSKNDRPFFKAMRQMLAMEPARRLSASECLDVPWLRIEEIGQEILSDKRRNTSLEPEPRSHPSAGAAGRAAPSSIKASITRQPAACNGSQRQNSSAMSNGGHNEVDISDDAHNQLIDVESLAYPGQTVRGVTYPAEYEYLSCSALAPSSFSKTSTSKDSSEHHRPPSNVIQQSPKQILTTSEQLLADRLLEESQGDMAETRAAL